jgi:hypothetical protein
VGRPVTLADHGFVSRRDLLRAYLVRNEAPAFVEELDSLVSGEWKRLALDMGEALRAAHDPERWSDFLTMQVADLLARLDGAPKEDDDGTG